MIFSIDTVCKELRWEYGYTKKKAMQIIKAEWKEPYADVATNNGK